MNENGRMQRPELARLRVRTHLANGRTVLVEEQDFPLSIRSPEREDAVRGSGRMARAITAAGRAGREWGG